MEPGILTTNILLNKSTLVFKTLLSFNTGLFIVNSIIDSLSIIVGKDLPVFKYAKQYQFYGTVSLRYDIIESKLILSTIHV